MTTVTYENGVKLIYDEQIKVGDIITAYTPGYHCLTEIVSRDAKVAYTPLFKYTTIMNGKNKLEKSKRVRACDASFCRLAKEMLPIQIKELEESIEALKQLQETL